MPGIESSPEFPSLSYPTENNQTMKTHFLLLFLFAITSLIFAQHPSIHQEQAARYKDIGAENGVAA
jgi:hypothetical protein